MKLGVRWAGRMHRVPELAARRMACGSPALFEQYYVVAFSSRHKVVLLIPSCLAAAV